MVRISIERVINIGIDKFPSETNIDLYQQDGTAIRLELSTADAEYLESELRQTLNKI